MNYFPDVLLCNKYPFHEIDSKCDWICWDLQCVLKLTLIDIVSNNNFYLARSCKAKVKKKGSRKQLTNVKLKMAVVDRRILRPMLEQRIALNLKKCKWNKFWLKKKLKHYPWQIGKNFLDHDSILKYFDSKILKFTASTRLKH